VFPLKTKAELFFAAMAGKTIAFVGVGVSNNDTIRLFLSKGIRVIVCDRRSREQVGALAGELETAGAQLRLGDDYLENLDADIVFRAPGVYFYSPAMAALRERGVIVTSEMEVFFDLCPCRTIAITGSEGKTTTSTVIAEMLKAQGLTVHLGGNIGKALLPFIFTIQPDDVAVVELSSFQLLSMHPQPDVAVVTNITPDHLDVHGSLEEYIGAKRNIYLHQTAFSRTVLGADNAVTASFAPQVRGDCRLFSLDKAVEHGAFYRDGVLFAADHGQIREILRAKDIRVPGMHNVANYLAAICAVTGLVGENAIRHVAGDFHGVEHRLEFVRELDGVRWYNDSIATAPPAVIAGLRAFGQKLILIGGGSDKKISYDPLAPALVRYAKLLLLAGPTAPLIEAAVKAQPDYTGDNPEILHVRDIPEAVAIARQRAIPGDVVTLSPASASFNAYKNFEERGRHFKELVNALS
jgi:UDP-N-acetylmuramoylalanine--D-glutamate ligase